MRALENWVLSTALILVLPPAGLAQSASPQPAVSPSALVRRVIANELKPQAEHSWVYNSEKEEAGKKHTKRVVQTRQGSLERLVAVDGLPLSADKQREEAERLEKIANHPKEWQKLEQDQKKDAEQCDAFFKMIPDAFLFNFEKREGDFITLSFKPNPAYESSSREAKVLHVMEGELLVHAKDERLASISGRLAEEVKFGGGLFGYLDKGGTFSVKRTEVTPGQWMMTSINVNMNGKALFIKTIAVQQKESRSNFQELAQDATLADAASILNNRIVLAEK